MKKISIIVTIFIVIAGLYGCGSKPGTVPAGSTPPATQYATGEATAQPTESAPAETAASEETAPPERTPWPEPSSVAYQGSKMDIAQDKDASKYPSLNVSQEENTCFGTMKIPAKWRIDDPDGIPTLVDGKGRIVGQIYQTEAHMSEPYFTLKPDTGTLITWETPGKYKYQSRAMTLDSDAATVPDGEQKTVIKIVSLFSNETYTNEDGTEYYLAFCLSFDKAYIIESTVDYVLSNQAIDEIVASFAAGLNLEE
jgi:hypothetical protein